MSALQLATPPSESDEKRLRSLRRSRRLPVLIMLAVLVVVAGLVTWRWLHPDPLANVELTSVRRADIEDTVTALGRIQPRDYVDVGAQVSGQLKHIYVQVGDAVEAGALLAEIDPQLQRAKLEIDRAQLAQLQAERTVQQVQVQLNQTQLARQTRMRQEGAARQDLYERAQSELAMAQAKLTSIDAQIRQVRSTTKADEAQLSFTRIFAPMRGTVVSIDARPGQTLIAAQQAPILLRLANLSSMTVWSHVSEVDVVRLHNGMELYFKILGEPQRKWQSTLRQLLPAPPRANADPSVGGPPSAGANNVVMYTALFDIDNTDGEFRPGMSAQVFFVLARQASALVVPTQALRELDETAHTASVTLVTAAGLAPRAVKLGIKTRFETQVLEGLSEGDRVVTRTVAEDTPETETP